MMKQMYTDLELRRKLVFELPAFSEDGKKGSARKNRLLVHEYETRGVAIGAKSAAMRGGSRRR